MDESRVDDIERCIRDAVFGTRAFTVSLHGARALPSHSRPSVVWIGVDSRDRLREMADAVRRNLGVLRIPFDGKVFNSHVIVERCRGLADLSEFFDTYGDREFVSFECGVVLMMRSVLGQGGALHSVLKRIHLT